MDSIVIFITAANREEAEKIGRSLVQEKLVACANIFPAVHSIYWWQGKIESSDEVFLMAKTGKVMAERVVRRAKELHSYEVPEVIALPIIEGNPDYLRWIEESTK